MFTVKETKFPMIVLILIKVVEVGGKTPEPRSAGNTRVPDDTREPHRQQKGPDTCWFLCIPRKQWGHRQGAGRRLRVLGSGEVLQARNGK